MKHRIIAIAICFAMLAATLVACGVTYDESSTNVTGYVYSPGGELIAKGKVTYHNIFSSGCVVVTINGVTYSTHLSNMQDVTNAINYCNINYCNQNTRMARVIANLPEKKEVKEDD